MTTIDGFSVPGFDLTPRSYYVFVAEYGQPQTTEGGVYLPNGESNDYAAYRFDQWRYGEVIAIGPGKIDPETLVRIPVPDVKLNDVIMFSRKHGSRLGIRYHHPTYKTREGLVIRVLDPEKIVAILDDFRPFWDVEEATPISQDRYFSG